MDEEEAPPPPYAAVDPLVPPANNSSNSTSQQTSVPLRQNVAEPPVAGSSRIAEPGPSIRPAIVPTHFTSAAAYFEERPPSVLDDSRSILHHHVTIYPRSQSKDFPRRPRCWASRLDELPQQDWDTFLRYLFPPHLGLAAASHDLPRQLRAEIQRDRKDRPQESDEQRRARIMAVVDEWNECFFEPRALRIVFIYIGEPDAAPTSALCPRCYPAATKATQGSGSPAVPAEQQNPWTPSTSSPVSPAPGPHTQPPAGWPFQHSPFGIPPGPTPYGVPYGMPPGQFHSPPPPPGTAPWQWNNWGYAPPQNQSPGPPKGGAMGWISNLTAQAQKYGERFAEQAQHYGDQISAQAMQYGRQVEEHALSHGRWMDDQGRYGRKPNPYPPAGYPYQPAWGPAQTNGAFYNAPTPPSTTSPIGLNPQSTTTSPSPSAQAPPQPRPQDNDQRPNPTQHQSQDQSQKQKQRQDTSKEIPSFEGTRRASVSSATSESSLSSFNSLSTNSDLDASDLEKVRTQLQSLNDCHERTLYDAAADLRHQLDVLQMSRREARASGRQGWRQGRLNNQSDPNRRDQNDWGRWDSPEESRRQAEEKKALKVELRATKKAFREVVRRARQEQHDAKKSRRNRRRQEKNKKSIDGGKKNLDTLIGSTENLTLNPSKSTVTTRAQTDPLAQSPIAPFKTKPMRAETSSSISSASSMHTPSSSQASTHDRPGELPERKGKLGTQTRLRDKLKPRSKKQQQVQRSSTEPISKDEDSKGDKSSLKKGKR
ncbi:hypothetical protein N7478_007204 [Penicillium angulare]|uniref:uncharacterized protein n=1 Tax=Penicillium angulare TaxID=116970 RepID=UPI0025405815|nr:uncharacterized protein N7478_007204 [Penicillium angulare]KAJ5281832.1 hypothetical protein N7478_007204 [Penicillium angulare]